MNNKKRIECKVTLESDHHLRRMAFTTIRAEPVPWFSETNSSFDSNASQESNQSNNILDSLNAKPTILRCFAKAKCQDIAIAITIQFSNLFLKVSPLDFLKKVGWGLSKYSPSLIPPADSQRRTSALDKLILLFNRLSKWVTLEILIQSDKSIQKEVLEKFITVAKKLYKLGNFDATLAIVSGLNGFAIQRLSNLWSSLDESTYESFQKLDLLFSPVSNFKSYFSVLESFKSPVVPYIGLLLRDFTFLAENKVEKEGVINFSLCRQFWHKWISIKRYQQESYRFTLPDCLLNFLDQLSLPHSEDEVYKLSLLSESSSEMESLHSIILHSSSSSSRRRHTIMESPNQNEARKRIQKQFSIPNIPTSSSSEEKCHCASGPFELQPLLSSIEKQFEDEYSKCLWGEMNGIHLIRGQRQLIFRANSLGRDFLDSARETLSLNQGIPEEESKSGIANLIYTFGFLLGNSEAKNLSKIMELPPKSNGILACNPILMAYNGMGRAKMLGGNCKDQGEIHYKFEIVGGFEGNENDTERDFNSCLINAGHAAGWWTFMLGKPATVCEVTCRYSGHHRCLFTVTCSEGVEDKIRAEISEERLDAKQIGKILLPSIRSALHGEREMNKKSAYKTISKGSFLNWKRLSTKSPLKNSTLCEIYNPPPISILEQKVKAHAQFSFGKLERDPSKGQIYFSSRPNDRQIILRGSSISIDIYEHFLRVFGNREDSAVKLATQFSDNIGNILGRSDMKFWSRTITTGHEMEKLYFLPHVMSQMGWGKLEISSNSNIRIVKRSFEKLTLIFHLTMSCEADGWTQSNKNLKACGCSQESPVCVMTAGYIAGWLSEAFGMDLFAVEVSCSKKKNSYCTFVVAETERIEEQVKRYLFDDGKPSSEYSNLIGIQLEKMKGEGIDVLSLLGT
eukprot:TRINITY_DN3695_c0_g1_i6.p1 TRINITY_DN3695_c0_g1~~TRINITY_DN3695_c0_g1_i6.p1  ORF type:complete len:908 (+),score=278.30 TRINITY_DN3695_c0_g1_i6:660-3383(+)